MDLGLEMGNINKKFGMLLRKSSSRDPERVTIGWRVRHNYGLGASSMRGTLARCLGMHPVKGYVLQSQLLSDLVWQLRKIQWPVRI
jgi:hypothetical protein